MIRATALTSMARSLPRPRARLRPREPRPRVPVPRPGAADLGPVTSVPRPVATRWVGPVLNGAGVARSNGPVAARCGPLAERSPDPAAGWFGPVTRRSAAPSNELRPGPASAEPAGPAGSAAPAGIP